MFASLNFQNVEFEFKLFFHDCMQAHGSPKAHRVVKQADFHALIQDIHNGISVETIPVWIVPNKALSLSLSLSLSPSCPGFAVMVLIIKVAME